MSQQSSRLLSTCSPPLFFSLFLLHFCSFAGHLVGFILVGNCFRKAFRILELNERKGRRVVEQDFHGNFQVNVTWFFYLYLQCPWLNWAHSGMVWKISSPGTSCPWQLKMMMSQVIEGAWICQEVMGGSGVHGLSKSLTKVLNMYVLQD